LTSYKPDTTEQRVELFKYSLAVAAPALIPLVILISTDALTMLRIASLDRVGLLAAAVVFITLAYMLWKGRWWAGLPAVAIFAGAATVFLWKAVRPLWAYYQVNPFNSPEGGLTPFIIVSPSLVIVVISVVLGRLSYLGIKTSLKTKKRPVSMKAWGVLAVWVFLLFGDAVYQETGWRYVKNPNDLVLRLCLGDESTRTEARGYLMEMGPSALPALHLAIATPDPSLECLREQSRSLLENMKEIGPKPI
jgi:hypothetical protein